MVLMDRETRQGMMNEHIRVGRQYPEISQLLLYSTGLQDQEFVWFTKPRTWLTSLSWSLCCAALKDENTPCEHTDLYGNLQSTRRNPLHLGITAPAEVIMQLSQSKDLMKRAKRLMPAGVNSPVRAFHAVGEIRLHRPGRGADPD